ncbi:hypothetical protein SCO02_15250 [Staphylococcus ureilyticus]|uniref:Uncharacterized protein n=1 Tax=Staphylococcus ureilyticus TaxID=94138 RepID=A0AB34AJ44_STAUR|nr:hypothetical protein [Staphylococcus ureilyticus]GEQ03084.1 hypothetical protein SCO02_15250 [Staphylococcus ureilyticus]
MPFKFISLIFIKIYIFEIACQLRLRFKNKNVNFYMIRIDVFKYYNPNYFFADGKNEY